MKSPGSPASRSPVLPRGGLAPCSVSKKIEPLFDRYYLVPSLLQTEEQAAGPAAAVGAQAGSDPPAAPTGPPAFGSCPGASKAERRSGGTTGATAAGNTPESRRVGRNGNDRMENIYSASRTAACSTSPFSPRKPAEVTPDGGKGAVPLVKDFPSWPAQDEKMVLVRRLDWERLQRTVVAGRLELEQQRCLSDDLRRRLQTEASLEHLQQVVAKRQSEEIAARQKLAIYQEEGTIDLGLKDKLQDANEKTQQALLKARHTADILRECVDNGHTIHKVINEALQAKETLWDVQSPQGVKHNQLHVQQQLNSTSMLTSISTSFQSQHPTSGKDPACSSSSGLELAGDSETQVPPPWWHAYSCATCVKFHEGTVDVGGATCLVSLFLHLSGCPSSVGSCCSSGCPMQQAQQPVFSVRIGLGDGDDQKASIEAVLPHAQVPAAPLDDLQFGDLVELLRNTMDDDDLQVHMHNCPAALPVTDNIKNCSGGSEKDTWSVSTAHDCFGLRPSSDDGCTDPKFNTSPGNHVLLTVYNSVSAAYSIWCVEVVLSSFSSSAGLVEFILGHLRLRQRSAFMHGTDAATAPGRVSGVVVCPSDGLKLEAGLPVVGRGWRKQLYTSSSGQQTWRHLHLIVVDGSAASAGSPSAMVAHGGLQDGCSPTCHLSGRLLLLRVFDPQAPYLHTLWVHLRRRRDSRSLETPAEPSAGQPAGSASPSSEASLKLAIDAFCSTGLDLLRLTVPPEKNFPVLELNTLDQTRKSARETSARANKP
eukprot:GHVT01012087.1.p1 GENE.GHVT01012087.1~~GHVT01012087.1.p1  ORF type:complete len:763 (+),score=133.21 GHVT01012087.1:537-2825(+)